MILDQKVKVKWVPSNKNFYVNKGYNYTRLYEEFMIDVKDLSPGSKVLAKCVCDFCGKIFYTRYSSISNDKFHSCGDKSCINAIRKQTCLDTYGVENVNQIPEIRQKGANTFKNRYGKDSDIHDEFINKRKMTNIQRHSNAGGYHHDLSSEIHSKIVNTLYNNYLNAKCKKGSKKVLASKRQVEICEALNGILNYEFNNKFVDIALPDEKLAIEYDGGGRGFWNDFHNTNDSIRDDLLSEHWKVIHILDSRDNVFPDIKPLIELCKSLDSSIILIDLIKHQIYFNNNSIKLNENNGVL